MQTDVNNGGVKRRREEKKVRQFKYVTVHRRQSGSVRALIAPTPFHRVKPVSAVFQDQQSLMSSSLSVGLPARWKMFSTNAATGCARAPPGFGYEAGLLQVVLWFDVPEMCRLL